MTGHPDTRPPSSLRVTHVTRYAYEEPVSLSLHLAWLRPRDTPNQQIADATIRVEPEPRVQHQWTDYFGNHAGFFSIGSSHRELIVTSSCRVRVRTETGPDPRPPLSLSETTRRVRAWETPDDLAALEFLMDSPLVTRTPNLAAYAGPSLSPERPLLEGAGHLMTRIFEEFRYDPDVTSVSTPVSEVLSKKHGVCQDFAHLMIGCLRSVGAPARYVSGYLVPDEGVVGAQASHAWVSVYCPGHGWVDFDPTNNVRPSTGHVTVAWGRDYSDVTPVRGVIQGGGAHLVHVRVRVEPAGDESTSIIGGP